MTSSLPPTDRINQARERILEYFNRLKGFFIARDDILKLIVTATTAQEPMLFVGRPGTAKSLMVSVFCDGLGLSGEEYFEYMLTKFTEPSEVMGPVDIAELKQGKYLRKVKGYLPVAKVAFLDEIFKANSAILNLLLTIINERKYYQEGNPVPVPLTALFAASNEIPDFGEFDALKDRFILKVETVPVKEARFHDLLRLGARFENRAFRARRGWRGDCRLDDFLLVHDHVSDQVIPRFAEGADDHLLGTPEMTMALRTLVGILENELKVEITDRKLIKMHKLMITQAFLFNGGRITRDELALLRYCGNNFKDIRKLRERLDELLAHIM